MRSPTFLLLSLLALSFSLATELTVWREQASWHKTGGGNFWEVMMGDSRRLFANHFLAKADAYLHDGVYPSIFDQKKEKSHLVEAVSDSEAGHEGESEQEHAAHHHHDEVEEHLAAGATDDTSDWIQRFGRNFMPTSHRHADEEGKANEVLPWLRIAADLNPNQPETYTVAAYWLRSRLGKVRDAEEFLHEGWRANPDSYEIPFEMGRLQLENLHNPDKALNLFDLALRLWNSSQGNKSDPDNFTLMQITAHLARLEEQSARYKSAIQHLEILKKVSPHPDLIQKQINEIQQKIENARQNQQAFNVLPEMNNHSMEVF